ncbi:hypothetical protein [uncultured Sphingomonas sp.]|uniref:hypothetical protein n=1 Tax=uncultured Sphingomonas sp. TaxID=158754 RepID=UPI0025CECBBA|nr:hypothetical protein [uncultured Sphingomonas sp.]
MSSERQRYPRKAVIERMIEVARASGIKVDGFEVGPTGNIRIISSAQAAQAPTASAYDRWKAGNK